MKQCPWAEQVAISLDGNFESPELRRHLTACSDCRELLEELQSDRLLLQQAPEIEESAFDEVRGAVLDRIVHRPRRAWMAVAAGVIVAALGATVWLNSLRPSDVPEAAALRPVPAPAVIAVPVTRPPVKHRARPAVSADRLALELSKMLEQTHRGPVTSDAGVVITAATSDPDVVFVLIGDTNETLDE
jgi:hypothetical protein